jgi:tartronate-semialdehyde synthase
MPKMTAAEAAVKVLESEGVDVAVGVPGAAILPFYEGLKGSSIKHVLVRHEEGGSHSAEGYARAGGKVGVNIGTSGPAGTNMITGLYSAIADSIPILCITGQAPTNKLHKEDFQAIDIAAIAKPVTKWSVTVMEGAQVPWAFRYAFQIMKSGRPGPVLIDLPLDVQNEMIEYDPESDVPLEIFRPRPNPRQISKVFDMLYEAETPLVIAGGGVINADASELLVEFAELINTPVVPTLMGWGAIPDDHPLQAGQVGLQTQHRYGNATFLQSDFVIGIGNRWANRHTGTIERYSAGRKFVHIDIDPNQIGRVFGPDLGIVSDAELALEALVQEARKRKQAGQLRDRSQWVAECLQRKSTMLRRTDFDDVPIKPQRVFQEINNVFGRDTRFVTSACIGAKLAMPESEVVGVVGDYSFQFLIEEIAVAAQHRVPFVMVLINNSYLGLIRQAQKAYKMDFEVQLSFENVNCEEIGEYGVDHVRAVEALGGKCFRVFEPDGIAPKLEEARVLAEELQLPVVVEVITERKTDIAMGPEIDEVTEFEEILDVSPKPEITDKVA